MKTYRVEWPAYVYCTFEAVTEAEAVRATKKVLETELPGKGGNGVTVVVEFEASPDIFEEPA